MAKEDAAEPLAGSFPVVLEVLAHPDQVPEGFLLRGWHPDRRQLAGSVKPGQHLDIEPIGLHSTAWSAQGERRGYDVTKHTQSDEKAVCVVACGARLVAGGQWPADSTNELAQGRPVCSR